MQTSAADILIIGADGANGLEGAPGISGKNSKETNTGQPGKNGSSSWFGCNCAGDGESGANAVSAGGPGLPAGHAQPAPFFELYAQEYKGNILVISQGGRGGNGGPGGPGGDGDTGGNAGKNVSGCVKSCSFARGGTGGNGSDGGRGGPAGDGGNGGTVLIYYVTDPPAHVAAYTYGGEAGDPGVAGTPGTGAEGGLNEVAKGEPPTRAFSGYNGLNKGGGAAGYPGNPGAITFKRFPSLK